MRILALLLALSAATIAQEKEMETVRIPKPGDPWKFYAGVQGTYESAQELRGLDVEVERYIAQARFLANGPITYGSDVQIALNYEERFYNWEGSGSILPGGGDPWDQVHVLNTSVTYLQGLSETWGILARLGGTVAAEEFDDWGDGFSWSVGLMAGHVFCKSFRAAVGVGYYEPEGDDTFVIPLVQFQWFIDEKWTLELMGLGPELIYKHSEAWEFALGGYFETVTFRLRETAPGNSSIVDDSEIYVYGRATWKPSKSWRLDLRAGAIVSQLINISDSNGQGDVDYENDNIGIVVSFRATFNF